MNNWVLTGALFAALTLTACEKKPDAVNPPVEPASVPGPASPPGAAGGLGQQVPQGALVDPEKADESKAEAAPPPAEPAPAN